VADQPAFVPDTQSEYAFSAPQAGEDDSDQVQQRNQQIQAAFDTQRMQRTYIQNIVKSISRLQQKQ
jgi:hypothetical protein